MLQLLIPAVASLLDKVLPDPKAKAEAKLRLVELAQEGSFKELEAAMTVITAEAKSEHWIVAAWRPITMLVFTAIIFNNYLLYPYLVLFWDIAPLLELPQGLWTLLQIGLGGYVAGRSAEKAVASYKGKG
ncbi:MAG: hypothetical protein JKY52_14440 [Flavobacteriales bacterium]|nr:hypothetical protein [Flavobacteriales bacterium]